MALLGGCLGCAQGGTVEPTLKGTCELQPPDYALGVSVIGGYACVAGSRGGFIGIDVRDPTPPGVGAWESSM